MAWFPSDGPGNFLGGPTGPGSDPARDFPDHVFTNSFKISQLGQLTRVIQNEMHGGSVVAPILAGIAAVALFKLLYL